MLLPDHGGWFRQDPMNDILQADNKSGKLAGSVVFNSRMNLTLYRDFR